jgi:hypothetical protein
MAQAKANHDIAPRKMHKRVLPVWTLTTIFLPIETGYRRKKSQNDFCGLLEGATLGLSDVR